MLDLEKLKAAGQKAEEDNLILRAFLKGRDSDEVDRLVHKLHRELFAEADCISCSNCCRVIVPVLSSKDIVRISRALGMTENEFKNAYLKKVENRWMYKTKTCPFLTARGCSVYDYRPDTCRQYPYTDQKEIIYRLVNLVANCEVCPVVFEIFERLKKIYRREFVRYKKQMIPYWKELFGD